MRYGFFSAAGRIESAHNDDTVLQIPDGAIELSDQQWMSRFDLKLVDGQITISPIVRPIQQVKEVLWSAIKAERDRRIQSGGYKVGAKWFHSDTFSRTQQMGLVMLGASIPANTPWKTMDGTTVTMTQALAGQIFATAAASNIAIFAAAETHRAAMEAAADPATYDFSSGRPAVFEG